MAIVGRLAPSPTGLLHLGNAWAFLWAWLACRAAAGRMILRMEDIDATRSRSEYASAIIQDLEWLGLDWDEEPVAQSSRYPLYEQALERLKKAHSVYPCYCTRRELREQYSLANAPHVGDLGAPYLGACRTLLSEDRAKHEQNGRKPGWRLRCPDSEYAFVDGIYGPQQYTLAACGGDFLLQRSDGVWAYQLAVVVDDGLMGVTQVVRGQDILASTPRQLVLFELLGFSPPHYAHVPLLCDEHGDRLAKRHQSLTLAALRHAGQTPQAVIGLLAYLARLRPTNAPIHPRELLAGFSLSALPKEPVRLPAELHADVRFKAR